MLKRVELEWKRKQGAKQTTPCLLPFDRLAELHNPHRLGTPVQSPQEVNPRRHPFPDPVALVGTDLPSGYVVEAEALPLMPGNHGKGGEGVWGYLEPLNP